MVAPEEWLAPYERYLPDTPAAYRTAWGAWVAARLEMLREPLADSIIEVHVWSTYAKAVTPPLQAPGTALRFPSAG